MANGCSIQSILSYFKVTAFPVFWTLLSNSVKLVERSRFSSVIWVAGMSWFAKLFLDIIGVNVRDSLSTSTKETPVFILSEFLKSSTKNPVLNLFRLLASCICKVAVFSSKSDNDVTFSRFSTLFSIFPMSLIVYLRLSTKDSLTSLVEYRYAGMNIVPNSITASARTGAFGLEEGIPFST